MEDKFLVLTREVSEAYRSGDHERLMRAIAALHATKVQCIECLAHSQGTDIEEAQAKIRHMHRCAQSEGFCEV